MHSPLTIPQHRGGRNLKSIQAGGNPAGTHGTRLFTFRDGEKGPCPRFGAFWAFRAAVDTPQTSLRSHGGQPVELAQ
jgi:hypothetical protein